MNRIVVVLQFATPCLVTEIVVAYGWRQWFVPTIVVVGLVAVGGVRFLPWGGSARRAASTGVMAGVVVSMILFVKSG